MNEDFVSKNTLTRKIKFSIILTATLFILGGLWMPIAYGAEFTIIGFLGTGAFITILAWVSILVARFAVFKN